MSKQDNKTTIQNESEAMSEEVQQQILRALAGLGYGSVEIIVHDSKVVQIERKEKFRIRKDSSPKDQ